MWNQFGTIEKGIYCPVSFQGPLSFAGMREAAAYFRTERSASDISPDVQYQLHSIDIKYEKRFSFLDFSKPKVVNNLC